MCETFSILDSRARNASRKDCESFCPLDNHQDKWNKVPKTTPSPQTCGMLVTLGKPDNMCFFVQIARSVGPKNTFVRVQHRPDARAGGFQAIPLILARRDRWHVRPCCAVFRDSLAGSPALRTSSSLQPKVSSLSFPINLGCCRLLTRSPVTCMISETR